MKANWSNFKLGLFVLVGVALLLTALFVFGASRLFEGKSVEETYVAGDAGGLQNGALVTLRGVPVGEVSQINFSWNIYHKEEPRYVVIEFTMRNTVSLAQPGPEFGRHVQDEIRKGLRARIKSQGLAGATILSLEYLSNPSQYPPLPFTWKPRHIYIPSAPGQFTEILDSLNETMSNLKAMNFKELGTTLQADLAAGERVLTHFDKANVEGISTDAQTALMEFERVGSNVNTLIDELRTLGNRLNSFVGEPEAQKGRNLPEISASADALLLQMRAATARLQTISANLDTSSINQTLEQVQRATANLEQVARELKRYPSGVLFGKPPPPAHSVEPTGR